MLRSVAAQSVRPQVVAEDEEDIRFVRSTGIAAEKTEKSNEEESGHGRIWHGAGGNGGNGSSVSAAGFTRALQTTARRDMMLASVMNAAALLCLPVIALAGPLQEEDLRAVDKSGQESSEESGRIFHSAVWTGKEVIVWGGGADGIFHNNGMRIVPGAKSSRQVTRTGAPTGRWGHAAVWTGGKMIVWGGRDQFPSFGNRRDGAIYDPASDEWKLMTAAGAPEGRSQMAAAWTGREMMVWGGFGEGSTAWSSGGRYDPALDKWEALPALGAPSARVESLSVWTGSEFIVWGGITPDLKRTLSDGARFNPAANTWTPIKESQSPPGVWGAPALWSGTEMIFWSGARQNGDENVNTVTSEGFAFHPGTASWRKLPTEGAPAPRFFHTSVWTGASMIVWGGGDQDGPLHFNDGAEFVASENRWKPLDWSDAPAARGMHTATWTPQGMIVFGGSTGGSSAFRGPELFVRR